MTTIKAIEGRSVHQITSGQVIVDLCSVVKELVENSLDAGATAIDVRFKNNGLESIEICDNGAGIAPENYETLALKHYTSKLSSYEDLTTLSTFGFRGEALSSLCALSRFHVVTARQGEAPKGKRLDFEISGKLKDVTVAASQKGTTVTVEDLFHNLPVRRRELEKNIKREYSRVLGLLHAYACISTGVRLSVSNQMPKGKKLSVFSTNMNVSTRDSIANVFGAKTLSALIPLDLELELQPTTSQVLSDIHGQDATVSRQIRIAGHISRPVFGEGRQAPDRQMFFVNSRPCGLPQIAKSFNEVYKSFNVTQSPFIFANLLLNTNAYDVNVSPDKRTILLHDQTALLETLKASLTHLFQRQAQTVPEVQPFAAKQLPAYRPLTVPQPSPATLEATQSTQSDLSPPSSSDAQSTQISGSAQEGIHQGPGRGLVGKFAARDHAERQEIRKELTSIPKLKTKGSFGPRVSESKQRLLNRLKAGQVNPSNTADDESQDEQSGSNSDSLEGHFSGEASDTNPARSRIVQDFNARMASQQARSASTAKRAFEIARSESSSPEREEAEVATTRPPQPRSGATLPDKITKAAVISHVVQSTARSAKKQKTSNVTQRSASRLQSGGSQFSQAMRSFAAPGTQLEQNSSTARSTALELSEPPSASEESEYPPLDNIGSSAEDEAEAESQTSQVVLDEIESDEEYLDESGKKRIEEERVAELIQQAESAAAQPTQANKKRAAQVLSSSQTESSTLDLTQFLDTTVSEIQKQLEQLTKQLAECRELTRQLRATGEETASQMTAEERLSLTISRSDFDRMRVVGQFNLGFVLATRPSRTPPETPKSSHPSRSTDDLFIIDQHASDEIYNFTRLSKTTTLTPQPLVRPHQLELTAVEEETISTHISTLSRNGFTVSFDTSGTSPVGLRCKLLTLPTSKETTFDTRDLEELVALLTEVTPTAGEVVRPTKVRRMLAMRACRSSIMVGRTLVRKAMEGVVRHMGEIERPWNCPHGRPTMRHLAGLDEWRGWVEGEGLVENGEVSRGDEGTDWLGWLKGSQGEGLEGVGEDDEKDNAPLAVESGLSSDIPSSFQEDAGGNDADGG